MLVVIAGAGPTGLTAANLLGKAGIETLLLEHNAGLSHHPKAITIDDEGLRICQALGLRDAILEHTLLDIQAHYVSQGHYLAKVAPTDQRNAYPLISTFHQPAFEATLLKGLERFDCVKVLFKHTVESLVQDEHGLTLMVRTPGNTLLHIKCAYLLACDGSKSTIRNLLGIPMRPPTWYDLLASEETPRFSGFSGKHSAHQGSAHGKNGLTESSNAQFCEGAFSVRAPQVQATRPYLTQQWLVVDCINDDSSASAVIFFCNPQRPAVTVPSPYGGRRWEFMLLPGERPQDMLSSSVIHSLIKQTQATQPKDAADTINTMRLQIIRQAIYTFESALAVSFSSGERIFLLGDAAHLMPPFGGQGMNSGLRDAYNLCWKLQMVIQEQADPSLLATYQQERIPHVAQMILFSSLLGSLIMPTSRSLAYLRDLFFQCINTIPPVREALSEMRVKPQPRYTKGFLLPSQHQPGKALIGALLPQPQVLASDGRRILLDDVLGDGFTLLRLYENPQKAFAGLRGEIWQRLEVRAVCVLPGGTPLMDTSTQQGVDSRYISIIDIDQQLSTFLHHNRDLFVLVRPDRYVMSVFSAEQADSFAMDLENVTWPD